MAHAITFESALKFVLKWEGGYVNDPHDPGGATNKGITQRVYDGWRTRHKQSKKDVRNISDAEVQDIYRYDYWLPVKCDHLKSPLSLVHFDPAVNMGPSRSVRFLQRTLNCKEDGIFGPATQHAVDAIHDVVGVCVRYCGIREEYYRELVRRNPDLARYLKGWLNRLNDLRKTAGLLHAKSGKAADAVDSVESVDEVESESAPDFGDAPNIARIPDVGQDPRYDL